MIVLQCGLRKGCSGVLLGGGKKFNERMSIKGVCKVIKEN